jgi:hypothetical protein
MLRVWWAMVACSVCQHRSTLWMHGHGVKCHCPGKLLLQQCWHQVHKNQIRVLQLLGAGVVAVGWRLRLMQLQG